MPALPRKRLAQAVPFCVLFGAAGVGIMALPQISVTSAAAFEMALAGVCLFFVGRFFHRRIRRGVRAAYHRPKLSPAEKRERRRSIRKGMVSPWGR